ncbi:MAG: restriction endonuclease subunit S [Natronincolaceae bacterium]
MSRWREVRLEDKIKTLKGFAFKSSFYKDKGVPVVRVSDFTEWKISKENIVYVDPKDEYEEFKLKEMDILCQTVGSWLNNPKSIVGKIVRVPKYLNNSYLNQNIVKIIPKKKISNNFLFYRLKADDFKYYCVNSAQGAANQASITLETIRKFKFQIPDPETQEKIADILSTYDELIENNNRRIEILEKTAEEIYKEWFVRMRFPGHENTRFEKGIPEGWEEVKLEDICNLDRGISYSTKEVEKDLGIAMLTLKSVNAYGGYNYDGLRFYDGKISDRHYIKKNDLIMAITDMTQDRRVIGQVCLVPRLHYEELVFSADLILLDDLKIEKSYMYSLLRYGGISRYISTFSNGANVLHLNQRTLNNIRFYIAPEKLRIDYDKIHVDIQDKINNLQLQNQNLAKQRDLLLPRLMNGTIEVK